jgi:hypothetical protein
MTLIYHPVTDLRVDVPDFSVFHYRMAGWMTQAEWDEQRAEEAARKAKAEEDAAREPEDAPSKAGGRRSGPPPLRAADAAEKE